MANKDSVEDGGKTLADKDAVEEGGNTLGEKDSLEALKRKVQQNREKALLAEALKKRRIEEEVRSTVVAKKAKND